MRLFKNSATDNAYDRWQEPPETDLEVKWIKDGGSYCEYGKCCFPTKRTYFIGRMTERWQEPIELCEEHDTEENAFQVFETFHQ